MLLAENIRDYYFAHIDELTEEKQFHLCSRLAAWESEERAIRHLSTLRDRFVPDPCTKASLRNMLAGIIDNPPAMPANAAKVRNAYFEKYPWLRGLELGLFRVRHLQAVYGVDARPALFDIVSRKQLLDYKEQLVADPEALRILSTYAVNFLYILERQILQDTSRASLNVNQFYHLGDGYNVDDPIHLQLYIYLYTHCIIAESNFYTLPLPTTFSEIYTAMLQKLEPVIQARSENLSLDTKLEFLVCCRIANHNSPGIEKMVYEECERSVSSDGTFVVDTRNAFAAKSDKKTFDASEHRNVLLVMSTSPYSPNKAV